MVNFLIGAIDTQTVIMLVLLAVMVVVLIVLPMFTNKRRNKAINDLHSSLRPGDVIKTVGGIVGTIVEIKEINAVDKEMVVETGVGNNKSTMVFAVQAVYQVISKVEAPVQATETAPFTELNGEVKSAQDTVVEEKTESATVTDPEVTTQADEPAVENEVEPAQDAKNEEAATIEEKKPAAPRKPRAKAAPKK